MTRAINDRIALAKGWTWTGHLSPLPEQCNYYSEWLNPRGRVDFRPDFVGTLEGVAGMMRELNEREQPPMYWTWGYCPLEETVPQSPCYIVTRHYGQVYCTVRAHSNPDRPADCIGEAWMSEIGKEA